MLKKRLIPCLIIKDGLLVQSIGFRNYLSIGRLRFTVERFNEWDVDEVIIIDISATPEGRGPNFSMFSEVSKYCFVPTTIGGGIRNIGDIRGLLNVGADKVCINTEAIKNPEFITEASRIFGSQCIVISIDAKKSSEGSYEVFMNSGKEPTGMSPVEWARKVEDLGAGEIFLNSIDRDGMKNGYDTELIKLISDSVSIPVIACGGVGKMSDFPDAILKGNASAASASNIFQHSEHSTIKAKAAMKKSGIDVRISIPATYLGKDIEIL